MRHNYLKPALALTLLLGASICPTAQIVLHDATNVTQTKATLSADFPDTSLEHGFQYKYGILPSIDDFSRCALAPNSDPVQISTTGNKWRNRDVKGWVESYGGLGNGQSSTMTASATIYEPTTLTFEWSVDSEDNYGILSFTVDDVEIAKISGEVPFTTVSTELTTGMHTLEWTYDKKSSTNVGLDLGMVRNINFQNTTPGKWVKKPTMNSELQLTNLYPNQSHIFRAYSGDFFSSMGQFKTDTIYIGTLMVDPVTQTTATFNLNDSEFGDAETENVIYLGKKKSKHKISNFEKAILSGTMILNDSATTNFSYDNSWNISTSTKLSSLNYVYTKKLGTSEITLENIVSNGSQISFEWVRDGAESTYPFRITKIYFYIDDVLKAETTNRNYKETISFDVGPGKHTFKWVANVFGDCYTGQTEARNSEAKISWICLTNISEFENEIEPSERIKLPYKVENLEPDTEYGIIVATETNYDSEIEKRSNISNTPFVSFRTLPVVAKNLKITDLSQASATISAIIDAGDANLIGASLRYKNHTGTRWTSYEKDFNCDSIGQKLTRLKPNSEYDFGVVLELNNNTIISNTLTFKTLPVVADTPKLISVDLYSAELEGNVIYGDANIYQRGMQFKKATDSEWEEVEYGGDDSNFILLKQDLELNTAYQARTYVQPAGCDTIFSNTLYFRTKHFVASSDLRNYQSSQTTAKITFHLEDTNANIKEAGIEYSSVYGENWIKVMGQIFEDTVIVQLSELTFNTIYYYRPYVKVDNEYYYYDNWERSATFKTLDVTLSAQISDITQTKAKISVSKDFGDIEVTDLRYCLNYGEFKDLTDVILLTNLCPGTNYTINFSGKINGTDRSWTTKPGTNEPYTFNTKIVSTSPSVSAISQTSFNLRNSYSIGDATLISYGFEYGLTNSLGNSVFSNDYYTKVTELLPNTRYYYRSFVETKEGGKSYSTIQSTTTSSIICTTDAATNLSNRSAQLNGYIDCDSYSSAEFGFQWKQMTGWNADPAFTKGRKQDDGNISIALVNGMLEPNTDYQYRTAVRYQDKIYCDNSWKTFRTESEFIYYPASVYTVFRTDRENNALVMCGYYIAGSESIVSQGYEYWKVGQHSSMMKAPQQTIKIETDESMHHSFRAGELTNGNYAIRAYVKTESGETLYGATLGFTVSADGYSEVVDIPADEARIYTDGTTLKVVNAGNLDCYIYNLSGMLIAERFNMSDYEEFSLQAGAIYLVTLSNGKVVKLRI